MGTCISQRTDRLSLVFNRIAPAVQAGRITYQSAQANQCLNEFATYDCIQGQGDASPCNHITSGKEQAAAGCFYNDECADGLFCDQPMGDGTCGKCKARTQANQSCLDTFACVDNYICNPVQTGTAANAMITATCIPDNLASNASCGPTIGACKGELLCIGGKCVAPATTQGAACDATGATGTDCEFDANLLCAASKCAQIAWSATNQPCGNVGGTPTGCTGDTYCKFAAGATMGTCTPLPASGPCAALDAQNCICASTAYLDPIGGANCIPLGTAGASCYVTSECSDANLCEGAVISTSPTPGKCTAPNFQACQ